MGRNCYSSFASWLHNNQPPWLCPKLHRSSAERRWLRKCAASANNCFWLGRGHVGYGTAFHWLRVWLSAVTAVKHFHMHFQLPANASADTIFRAKGVKRSAVSLGLAESTSSALCHDRTSVVLRTRHRVRRNRGRAKTQN